MNKLSDDSALIPILNGKPEITNRMKADCIGEFSFTIEVPEFDEEFELTGEMVDRQVHVPWTLCKEIYKSMASIAMLSATPPSGAENDNNPAIAAIEYALKNDEPETFLRLWLHGEFPELREEWENIPDAVFIGADPLFKSLQDEAENEDGD